MKLQKNLAILLIPMLILTIFWVGSNVYHSHIDSTIDIPTENSIKPIKGSFDLETVENIKSRTRVAPFNDVSGQPATTTNDNTTASPSSDLDFDLDDEIGTESAGTDFDEL